jgi:hypothetical protein
MKQRKHFNNVTKSMFGIESQIRNLICAARVVQISNPCSVLSGMTACVFCRQAPNKVLKSDTIVSRVLFPGEHSYAG